MRNIVSGATLLLIAGCASQPTPVSSTPAAQPPAKPPQGITLAEARRLGYKIVNENGKQVFCRDQLETGSHVRKDTICLTEEELIAAREASKRNLEQLQRIQPPPACGPLTGIGC